MFNFASRFVLNDLERCVVNATIDQWVKRGTNQDYKYNGENFWRFYRELYVQELDGRVIEVALIGDGRHRIQDSWLSKIFSPEMAIEDLTLQNAAISSDEMFITMPTLRYLNLAGDSILRISKGNFKIFKTSKQ